MADDKGSDLDVFEGLTRKKSSSVGAMPASGMPAGPQTLRGGVTPPASSQGRPLPAPRSSGGGSLPMPKAPPKKRSSGISAPISSARAALPKPKPPPSRRSRSSFPPTSGSGAAGMRSDSEGPLLSVKSASLSEVFDEGPMSGSILPGAAMADLDWDDDEEATSVFDRSTSDLFADIAGRARSYETPDADPKRSVGMAAALLASSGRSAAPVTVKSQPPPAMAAMPAPRVVPQIPAPAPVPRDISEVSEPALRMDAPMGRTRQPSWAPSMPPPAMRTGPSRSTMILAAVAVAVLAVAGYFYLRRASDASVTIVVTNQGEPVKQANIFIDGRSECEFSPCRLDLKPGQRHILVRAGALAGEKRIEVIGGKELRVDVALGVSGEPGPSPTSPVAAGTAMLELATEMKDVDVHVLIDGKDRGKLPKEISGLAPGRLELRFEGGDKYGKLKRIVELKAGQTLKIADVKLPLLVVKVRFELKTRGARVKLVRKDDRGKKVESTLTFRGGRMEREINTSYQWTLLATLKGYDDLDKELSFEDDKPKQTVVVALDKEKAVATGPGPEPRSTHTTAQHDQPTATGPATISANSVPPSKVIIDGRPRGGTPVTGVKVPPGSHTVIFKSRKYGTKSRTVTVGAGQSKVVVVRFKKRKKKKKHH